MFRLLILISVFLFGCSSTKELDPKSHLSGKWSFTAKGKDFEDIKDCEFFLSRKLDCTISEAGFSDGFGDAHIYKTTGRWDVKDNVLTLIEVATSATKQKTQHNFSIQSFTEDKMVLINHQGVQQTWYKNN